MTLSLRTIKVFLGLLSYLFFASSAYSAHIVKKGETLYSIAKKNRISVIQLKRANQIKDVTKIPVGKRLVIPSLKKKKASPQRKSTATTQRVALRTTTTNSQRERKASSWRQKTIIVDPGHGGRDIGASYGGVHESVLNMKTASKLKWYLQKAGYKVVMTRSNNRYVSLSRRAAIANRYPNALFVSIHYNACVDKSARGGETFHSGSQRGRYLASSIQSNLVRNCKVRNRGPRYGKFTVLHETSSPSVLVECGFISNSRERARCNTSAFQDAAARAILQGIQRYDRRY